MTTPSTTAALVSLLVHVDRNEYALSGVDQKELYDTMIAIADHCFGIREGRKTSGVCRSSDEEATGGCARAPPRSGERGIIYRQRRKALGQFTIAIEITAGNQADLVRYEQRVVGIFRKREGKVRVKIGTIGYGDEGTDIPKSEVKRIRELCALTQTDGWTSVVLFHGRCRYRRVLQRLARV